MNPPKAPESAVFLASTALIATGTSLMAIPVAGAGLVALGTAAFIALLLFEKRRGALIHPALLRPRLVMSYSAAMLNYSATFALTVLLSLYLENMKGMTPFEAGMVLTTQPVIQAALSPVAGFMAEKVDPSMIATIGMGIIAYGIFSLIPVISINRISLLYASLALLGIGFALFASPNTTAVVSLSPREAYASSLAFLATMRYFGQALSTSVIISVESLISSIESSIFVSLEIYVTLSIIGTILSYLARKR
jgi:MFS family permease